MAGDPRSWNPWHGCTKYSEGCAHCYMYALDEAHKVPEKSAAIVRTAAMKMPLARDRRGKFKIPSGYCLRTNMTSDTFLEEADPWRPEMWDVIRARPDVVFYLLTKRAHRIADCLPPDWGNGWDNVEVNVSCENQRAFDERWPYLRDVPAKHKGFNLAPLLGPIDITPALETGQIDLVNCGGESFGGTRPCHYEWVRRISDDCLRHGVNFTFDSTGSVFVMNGKRYRLRKGIQGEQAFKSGLCHFSGPVRHVLRSPEDGHILADDELCERVFNVEKCLLCPRLDVCMGCTICKGCKGAKRLPYEEMAMLRATDHVIGNGGLSH